jgi:hypothetical protein
MPTVRGILVLPFVMLAIVSTSAFAGQQHIVAPGQLATTVSEHVANQDADRAAVREALARAEVRDVVSSMGVDVDTVAAVVDTMTGTQLAQAGDAARQVNQQLVGGASTVVISTTAIILILLLVIILILALK